MKSFKPLVRFLVASLQELPEQEQDQAVSELEQFAGTMKERNVAQFFLSPLVETEKKIGVLEKAGLPSFPAVKDVLAYLLESKALESLPLIVTETKKVLAKSSGKVDAIVETAHALTAEQRKSLENRIADLSGAKSVSLEEKIDPTKLSGMTLRIGDSVLEASFAGKLQKIGSVFSSQP